MILLLLGTKGDRVYYLVDLSGNVPRPCSVKYISPISWGNPESVLNADQRVDLWHDSSDDHHSGTLKSSEIGLREGVHFVPK